MNIYQIINLIMSSDKQKKQFALLEQREKEHIKYCTDTFNKDYQEWKKFEPGNGQPNMSYRSHFDNYSTLSLTMSTYDVDPEAIARIQSEVESDDTLKWTWNKNEINITFKKLESFIKNKLPVTSEHTSTGFLPISNLDKLDDNALVELKHRFNNWTCAGTSETFELCGIPIKHKSKLNEWCREQFINYMMTSYDNFDLSSTSSWDLIIKPIHTFNVGRSIYIWSELGETKKDK